MARDYFVLKPSKFLSTLSIGILIGTTNFYAVIPTLLRIILFGLSFFLAVISNRKGNYIALNRTVPRISFAWIVFSLFVLTGFMSSKSHSIFIMLCIFLPFVLRNRTTWIKSVFFITVSILGINVLATYFFLLFPRFYPIMIKIYDFIPSGTSQGTAGYRAGIANHYSQNGIFISICLIYLLQMYIYRHIENRKSKYRLLLSTIILVVFFALILTGKRGVFLWALLSIIITYIISNGLTIKKAIKTALPIVAIAFVIYLLSDKIPQISYLINRFENIGEDSGSLERLAMWKLAIEKFKHSPFLGNGFWSFQNMYEQNLAHFWHRDPSRFQRLNAHNVYIQVLCETGVVGLSIYVYAIISTLYLTAILLQDRITNSTFRYGLLVSFAIQTFYLLYSMTGNCLYDIVFYFYTIAVSISLAIAKEKATTQISKGGLKLLLDKF